MKQSVEMILERNLLEVFNERDAGRRRAAIGELWNKDGVVIDPGGVHVAVAVRVLCTPIRERAPATRRRTS